MIINTYWFSIVWVIRNLFQGAGLSNIVIKTLIVISERGGWGGGGKS